MNCGAALFRACPRCSMSNPPDARFCLNCGSPLAPAAHVERRVLSVLFADLVASTAMATRLDPETTRAIVADYFAVMRAEIERHGGVVEKFIGDAVMAVFGLPAAHEDDPERAVRAALAMQAQMPDLNTRLRADLHIRIGISTGEVIADPVAVAAAEFMVTGEVVNLAARLQQHAPPDSIVVDDRTHRATRATITFRQLEPVRDGDFAGQLRWQVVEIGDGPTTRLRAPMIGREDELQFLQALCRRAVEGRKFHLVTIVGAAGVGKSRLIDELLDNLPAGAHPPQVMRGRCPAYGEGVTYRPLAEMLRVECGIKDNDSADAVRERLERGIRTAVESLLGADETQAIIADLASLLGVTIPGRRGSPDPRSSGDALMRSLRAFLIAKAQKQPVLAVVEDLHWAEESLLDLLRHLAIRGGDAPILILCAARPELLERHPDWGAGIRNYTAVSLTPLGAPLSQRLMAELLRGEALPADARSAILARAEGNPLFIQEILRMLIDGGGLVRDAQGWRWASRPFEIRIPDTIHGILASRLDLLSPLEKRCTQDASVAGRVFWLGSLVATSELSTAEAEVALARLQERDLIEERPTSSIAGEREFAFTHALIREVAYATLPKASRSANHLRFARWIEQTARDTDGFLGVLAHHYEHAWRNRFETGEPAPDVARQAIAVQHRAAARATTLRTFPEARRLVDRALAILHHAGLAEDLPLYLELLICRTEIVKWMSSPDLVLKDAEKVIRLAPKIGREDLLARAWLNLAYAEYDRVRRQPAEEALHQALELFGKMADRRGQAEAFEMLGAITEDLRGTLSTALGAYQRALSIYRELGDGQGMARTMAWHGKAVLDSGNLAEGGQQVREALALSRTHHERISEAHAIVSLAILAHLAGDPDEAVRLFHEGIALRQELGDPMSEAYIRRHLGMHYLRRGRLDEAEREFEAARTLRREHGVKSEAAVILRGLAEVHLARGDLLSASDYAEEALAALPREDTVARATHSATLGKVRAAQGRAGEAEELFGRAVETLEQRDHRIDLALTLLKYGEALIMLDQPARAHPVLERSRGLFAEIGATNLVRDAEARLAAAGGLPRTAV
jgi:predicted ATPase/class 3 adenylate cyclase